MTVMEASACALTISDIDTTIDNEPRILDLRLAEIFGYAKVQDLRQLASRHREALERFGEVSTHRASKPCRGTKGGRPSEGLAFNKKQALYLGGKTDLPAGIELLIAMVEVFDAVTAGRFQAPAATLALPAPASPERPFCRGCAGLESPLSDGPLTGSELFAVAAWRAILKTELKRAVTDERTKLAAAAQARLATLFQEG